MTDKPWRRTVPSEPSVGEAFENSVREAMPTILANVHVRQRATEMVEQIRSKDTTEEAVEWLINELAGLDGPK